MVRHVIPGSLVLGALSVTLAACSSNVSTAGTGGSSTTSTGTTTTSGTTTTGTTSTGTTTTGTTTTGTTTSTTTTSSSTGGGCTDCQAPFTCCGATCAYLQNDLLNCGACGHKCAGPNPYCSGGVCGTPPCDSPILCGPGGACCGTACCNGGQIACDVQQGGPTGGPTCQTPTAEGTCPKGCPLCVCASPDTPIATPEGSRPIADLAVGDLVYSVDGDAIVAVPVLRTNRAAVHDHHVVRVSLASGAVLEISPRHPTADGRTFGDLRAGDRLDRLAITAVERVPYGHPFTYDILPASGTHAYFAGGALIGTTLTP